MAEENNWISISAFAISILSLIAAGWSSWISHRALKHTREVYEQESTLSFAKEKAELLEVINTSRRLLDATRIAIELLQSQFSAEPKPVQEMMRNYTNLFTEYLPQIEGSLRQATSLWNEVFDWNEKTGRSTLVHHQAKFRALIHEDQVAHDSAIYCISVFKRELNKARMIYASEMK